MSRRNGTQLQNLPSDLMDRILARLGRANLARAGAASRTGRDAAARVRRANPSLDDLPEPVIRRIRNHLRETNVSNTPDVTRLGNVSRRQREVARRDEYPTVGATRAFLDLARRFMLADRARPFRTSSVPADLAREARDAGFQFDKYGLESQDAPTRRNMSMRLPGTGLYDAATIELYVSNRAEPVEEEVMTEVTLRLRHGVDAGGFAITVNTGSRRVPTNQAMAQGVAGAIRLLGAWAVSVGLPVGPQLARQGMLWYGRPYTAADDAIIQQALDDVAVPRRGRRAARRLPPSRAH